MSELSTAAKALVRKHHDALGAWPNIRYIAFAFCNEKMVRGPEDERIAQALPPLLDLVDKFLSEASPDSHEGLSVLESIAEPFIDMVKHIENKLGICSLAVV